MPCIVMEADWPSKNENKKMPILDMEVWMDREGYIMYQHYEKAVSSKTVLHSESAHSAACKRSVHTQEVLRRLLNSSERLVWKEDIAPVITEYMRRMMVAGYGENYRKSVLQHALGIYDKKWEDHRNGIRPICRPKEWKKRQRIEEKKEKKYNWANKDGHIAPIFIPSTPNGKLLKMMRKVAEEEAKKGLHFKILEIGGQTLKRKLQRSNPTRTPGCDDEDCIGCAIERGAGGDCRKNNINYSIECQLCPEGSRPLYVGETSRNLYTRGKEHVGSSRRRDGDTESGFMRRHMEEAHDGGIGRFSAKVTHSNKDCLSRQVREGVLIRKAGVCALNTKSEWFQPPLCRVSSHIVQE